MVVVVVVVVSMDMIELFDVVLLLMELNEPNLTGRGGVTERTVNTKWEERVRKSGLNKDCLVYTRYNTTTYLFWYEHASNQELKRLWTILWHVPMIVDLVLHHLPNKVLVVKHIVDYHVHYLLLEK